MKNGKFFFLINFILFLILIGLIGQACTSTGKTQNKEVSFFMLTQSYVGFGEKVNKNPSELRRLFDFPANFNVSRDKLSNAPKKKKHEKGWLGISIKKPLKGQPVSQKSSIEVAMVFPYSPAEEAGILEKDKIIGLDGNDFYPDSKDTILGDFKKSIETRRAGSEVKLKIVKIYASPKRIYRNNF